MGDRMPAAVRDHLPGPPPGAHRTCDLGLVSGGRWDLGTVGTWVDQKEERGRRGPPRTTSEMRSCSVASAKNIDLESELVHKNT